jgi:hypothetical protein
VNNAISSQVDLGDGRQFDLDFRGDNELWVSTGPGIEAMNLWVKTVIQEADFRIRVIRTQTGIEVIVDRGQQEVPWWPTDDCPRLTVLVDPNQGNVSVSARVGHGAERREALLGNVLIG